MKKPEGWKIKTGKDWCLAFLFAALMVYVAVVRFFQWKVLDFMQKFMPDKMSNMNLPGGYGTVLFWALIMALLVMAVLALRRQKRKYIAAAGLAGFLIADCALGGFVYHCRLIVQRGTEEPAASAWICFEDGTEQMKLAAGDETLGRLQALAFSLERQPAERQEELRALVRDGGKERSFVWFSFPDKYFHGYDPIFYIEDGLIYMNRRAGDVVFYKDNGLTECMEELKSAPAPAP